MPPNRALRRAFPIHDESAALPRLETKRGQRHRIHETCLPTNLGARQAFTEAETYTQIHELSLSLSVTISIQLMPSPIRLSARADMERQPQRCLRFSTRRDSSRLDAAGSTALSFNCQSLNTHHSSLITHQSSIINHQSSIINHILGFTAPPKLSTGLNLSGPTFLPRVAFYSLGLVELTLGSCCNAFGVTNPIARLNQIVKHAKPSLRLVKTLYWNRSTSSLDRR
jgi:hypothetical protein